MKYNVVLGAGLTGLSLATELAKSEKYPVVIIEKQSSVGGVSSSFKWHDSVLDYGPHKIFTEIDTVYEFIRALLGEDLLVVEKKSSICLKNKSYTYPLKLTELMLGLDKIQMFKILCSYMKQQYLNLIQKPRVDNYEDYVVQRFGKGLYELIFEPQATKIWGDPRQLSKTLAESRIPIPSFGKLVFNLLMGGDDKIGSQKINVSNFLYPKHGIQEMSDKLIEKIGERSGTVYLNSVPEKVIIENDEIVKIIFNKEGQKEEIEVNTLVSTIPIDDVVNLMTPAWDETVRNAANCLRYRASALVYFLVKTGNLSENHWMFFPEKKYEFNRTYEQKLFSAVTVPNEDMTIICLDFTLEKNSPFFSMEKDKITEILLGQLEESFILDSNLVEDTYVKIIDKVYPIYDLEYEHNLKMVMEKENLIKNFFTLGRLGLFSYSSMDHCIDMGLRTGKNILNGLPKSEFWQSEKEYFKSYRIVD